MATARISPKRTPRFRLAPRGGQNGAHPGYRAILHWECALGVLKDLFWFPGRFMCIGSRTPAQGAHPSAVEALGASNGQLPPRWSLLTTPFPKPHGPRSTGARAGCLGRVWLGLTSGQGILNVYQGGLERDYQDGRCLPPPPQKPMARGRPVREPGASGVSGWASRGARASPICTRGAGRRESHFGGRHRISFCSIRSTMGPRRPGPHGDLGGVLISILG